MRDPKHAAVEGAAFRGFLAAHPAFAKHVAGFKPVDDDFPDIVVTLTDGNDVDFEVTEWLHFEQIVIAKRRELLEKDVLDAIGPQGMNGSQHIQFVMLSPHQGVDRFEKGDAAPPWAEPCRPRKVETQTKQPMRSAALEGHGVAAHLTLVKMGRKS